MDGDRRGRPVGRRHEVIISERKACATAYAGKRRRVSAVRPVTADPDRIDTRQAVDRLRGPDQRPTATIDTSEAPVHGRQLQTAGRHRWRIGDQARLRDVVDSVVAGAGYDLEDLTVVAAGRRRLLRVVIDSDAGRRPRRCRRRSAGPSPPSWTSSTESGDPMGAAAYTLEVTSPGIGRPLTLPRHFRRARGPTAVDHPSRRNRAARPRGSRRRPSGGPAGGQVRARSADPDLRLDRQGEGRGRVQRAVGPVLALLGAETAESSTRRAEPDDDCDDADTGRRDDRGDDDASTTRTTRRATTTTEASDV